MIETSLPIEEHLKAREFKYVGKETALISDLISHSEIFTTLPEHLCKTVDDKTLFTLMDGRTMLFSGRELNQHDADVFDALLNAHLNIHKDRYFSYVDLLDILGKEDNLQNRTALINSVDKLTKSTITIKNGKRTQFIGHLVNSVKEMPKTKRELYKRFVGKGLVYEVDFNEDLSILFTGFRTASRVTTYFGQNQMAKWILRYTYTNKEGYCISSEKIANLTGNKESQQRNPYSFNKVVANGVKLVNKWKVEKHNNPDPIILVSFKNGLLMTGWDRFNKVKISKKCKQDGAGVKLPYQ